MSNRLGEPLKEGFLQRILHHESYEPKRILLGGNNSTNRQQPSSRWMTHGDYRENSQVTKSDRPNVNNYQSWNKKRGKIILDFGSESSNDNYIDKPVETSSRSIFFNQTFLSTDKSYVSVPPISSSNGPSTQKSTIWSRTNEYFSGLDSRMLYSPHRTFMLDINSSDKGTKVGNIKISCDPAALTRLIPVLLVIVSSITNAFMGTLRWMAPMLFARRVLLFLGDIISDYLTGRYFRTTYTRLERTYLLYYEMPSAFRALCRIIAQISIFFTLSCIMAWLVGVGHAPCRTVGHGLASFCGVLWISAVVGAGHAFSTAVSIWGGPLRIQSAHSPAKTKPNIFRMFTRPWHLLYWLKNPEAFLSMSATANVEPFEPNPVIFPATWIPLRLLQLYAVARVASTEPDSYVWCSTNEDPIPKLIRWYFVQLTLCDEWYRVFIIEKRVGLGITFALLYLVAMLWFVQFSVAMNPVAALLMIPSLLAILISGWMNVAIFWDRMEKKNGKRRNSNNTFGFIVDK